MVESAHGSNSDIPSKQSHVPIYPRNPTWQRSSVSSAPGQFRLMHLSKQQLSSITSSAIASTPGGIVRPRALAVVTLITSQRRLGDAVQPLQHQDREQRTLRAEIRVGRLEPFIERMPIAAAAAAADGDRGNAQRHRLVGIGA